MRRTGRAVVAGLLVAGLASWLLAASPARAQTAPPPISPGTPQCAAGPGGLLGCIPSPGDLLSGAAKSVGGGVMKAFTTFFTGGAKWFIEQVQSFLVAADRPDLSAGWWVHKYDQMLALAWVVAAATLLLALIDAAAKGSWPGWPAGCWWRAPPTRKPRHHRSAQAGRRALRALAGCWAASPAQVTCSAAPQCRSVAA